MVPEPEKLVIEAWKSVCKDTSPEALMFSTLERVKRKGQAVPRWGKNFLVLRVRPIVRKLGIPARLITFQVMRRTVRTDLKHHCSLEETQSVLQAVNSAASALLKGWEAPVIVYGSRVEARGAERRVFKQFDEV